MTHKNRLIDISGNLFTSFDDCYTAFHEMDEYFKSENISTSLALPVNDTHTGLYLERVDRPIPHWYALTSLCTSCK